MTVSVLVPVFKVEDKIERCARSLFTQTYPNLEYIFVNDCTPDRSFDILHEVTEEDPNRKDKITFINNEQNRGIAYCRNIAIAKAQGDFVCQVDSDDWLEPDAIEQLVREQQMTDADVVWGDAMMHSTDGESVLTEPHYADKHTWLLCYSRLTPGFTMVNWRRIIRRSLFTEHNIKAIEGNNYAEDKVIMTQVAYYAKSYSYINRIVYHYNQLSEDTMTSLLRRKGFALEVFQQEMRNILAIEDFWRDKESIFYEEFQKAKIGFLMLRLSDALRYSSLRGYNRVKRHIDSVNRHYYEVVGLDNWKSRFVYSNYYIAKTYLTFHR